MSLSTLPLSYCTNVHPAKSVAEVIGGLQTYTVPARKTVGQRVAAGLWLAASVIEEIQLRPDAVRELRSTLEAGDLACYTLNTFPYGDFHSERVKENVYLPDWTAPERKDYTLRCAHVLAELMPPGVEGSLSTVPLGFKGFPHPDDFSSLCINQLLEVAEQLDQLHDETGQVLRLAIEPEPCCVLETTAETIEFFRQLFAIAEDRGQLDVAQRHLGICYDVCHQAVEFEDVPQSVAQLSDAGIRINKVHLTCALHLEQPERNEAGRLQLADFVEPRYLHQTFARTSTGERVHQIDLTRELCVNPDELFRKADAWRIHFHVPVHREEVGHLRTTREELRQVVDAVARLDYAPHLEVETYTWGVLPGEKTPSLVAGLVNELQATQNLIENCRSSASATAK